MDELDLFGIRGGPPSVIHVMADELQKCKAVLEVSISGLTNFNRNFERGIIDSELSEQKALIFLKFY